MADLRDEHGNPIQLADQYGNPVQLTDEHGNPVHITGIATSAHSTQTTGPMAAHTKQAVRPVEPPVPTTHAPLKEHLKHEEPVLTTRSKSSSSSSSSSEDDGQGGRRKKKGLKQKIKETFGGGKHKTEDETETVPTATTVPAGSKTSSTVPGVAGHEKKGVMEKIKEKLPGHH